MKITDMQDAIRDKNTLLITQGRRIALLEEKMTAWRKKYFEIKYAGVSSVKKVMLEKQTSINF